MVALSPAARPRVSLRGPLDALVAAQGSLFPFVPVCIGIGIGLWFGWPSEPGGGVYLAAAVLMLACAGLRLWGPVDAAPLAVAGACVLAGFLAAGGRAQAVQAPVLGFRYYGPVEGRLVDVDRSQTDALRITLDRVVLEDMAPDRTPAQVRVSLQVVPVPLPPPGARVILTAHLAPPGGPVEPGGFDFGRMAFFDRLGAVGYTDSPVLLLRAAEGPALAIARLRLWLSAGIQAAVPGDAGAFAAGAMTGDRSGLSRQAVQDLRDSSLAHLLAISGMNLAFLIGFVFALIRTGMALVPWVALRVNGKKVAAAVSLAVAAFYLSLSGSNVATERAFVMVTVMLGAVLLDRRALTLRSVSVAGIVLLLWQPEAMLEPGFQMSFAATVALIAGFRAVDRSIWRGRLPGWAMPVFTLVLSSLIGGMATAPYAAASFNRFADFGLLANLLTVPVMGAVVMPAGAVAALLAPFGLAGPALWVMGQGSAWILAVAAEVAQWEGSVTPIPAPPGWTLAALTLGAAWVIVWPGRARWAGLGPVALALALWPTAPRPDLLIAADGRLAGLMGPEGRALSWASGGAFAAQNWLARDGDLAAQAEAAARPGLRGPAFDGPRGVRRFTLARRTGFVLTGRAGVAALPMACAEGWLVVLAEVADGAPDGCPLVDARVLRQTGALAVWVEDEGMRVVPAIAGGRLWSGPEVQGETLALLEGLR